MEGRVKVIRPTGKLNPNVPNNVKHLSDRGTMEITFTSKKFVKDHWRLNKALSNVRNGQARPIHHTKQGEVG